MPWTSCREESRVARISTAICTSHTPWLFVGADEWERSRQTRYADGVQQPDVPVDSVDELAAKHARCMHAFEVLRERLAAARPDVLLIFGDDQREQFGFDNFPAFNIFVGAEFSGYKISKYYGVPLRGVERPERPKTAEHWTTVKGHPELGRALMTGLVERGFDVAFSLEVRDPELGMGHAIMRPPYYLAPDYDIPVVPFLINCCYGPAPLGRRCYALGRAVREVIESIPGDLNVAVIGSGGLWHMLRDPRPIIDEEFDRRTLDGVRSGDARTMAAYFDGRVPPCDPGDPASVRLASNGTGMILGYGGGSGEVRNWIAATAVMDGTPGTVVDYVPIYASPIGVGFAHW
jgi:hypothetical protein